MQLYRAKAIPGVEGLLGYAIKPASVKTDPSRMTATVTITTEVVDRSRDVVVTKGIDLADHVRNPVVLLDHRMSMPVGVASDGTAYTVKRVNDYRIDSTTHFHQHTELGEQTFRLVESGVLRGASIGFLPSPGRIETGHDSDGEVTIYGASKLVEYSHVVLPDNPDCLVSAVRKGFGGKKLTRELLEYLTPLVPTQPVRVVGGFDNTRTRKVKAMSDDTLTGGLGDDTLSSAMDDVVVDTVDDGDDDDLNMMAGAQFAHLVHDRLTDLAGIITEASTAQEHAGLRKLGPKLLAGLGKLVAMVEASYADYQAEFADQPDLPSVSSDTVEAVEGGDIGDDDTDVDFDLIDADEPDDEQQKRLHRWRTKANGAWEHWKRQTQLGLTANHLKHIASVSKGLAAIQVKLAGAKQNELRRIGRQCRVMGEVLKGIKPVQLVTKAHQPQPSRSTVSDADDPQMVAMLNGLLSRMESVESRLPTA